MTATAPAPTPGHAACWPSVRWGPVRDHLYLQQVERFTPSADRRGVAAAFAAGIILGPVRRRSRCCGLVRATSPQPVRCSAPWPLWFSAIDVGTIPAAPGAGDAGARPRFRSGSWR
ncbi:hypothetical protein HBB16_20780 [Pseudonocardia sp. MCCB 268]|nr:hypothetical protein [Pseudonocardia cytotoxica]